MKKYQLEVTRKNGNVHTVNVYLDDKTAELLESTGDKNLLNDYLFEEYKSSRRNRCEEWWNESLEGKAEQGFDLEDNRDLFSYISLDNMDNEELQMAIKKLTPRQQEMLRLLYIEGRNQKEIANIFGIDKRSVSDSVQRTYKTLKKLLKK